MSHIENVNYYKKKQILLENLSESILQLQKIKEMIEQDKQVENEDFVLAAIPFRVFHHNFLGGGKPYNDYLEEL